MSHNYCCLKCLDTGKVGIFFKKICPQCKGDPRKYFLKIHPRPKPPSAPPPKRREKVDVYVYIHEK